VFNLRFAEREPSALWRAASLPHAPERAMIAVGAQILTIPPRIENVLTDDETHSYSIYYRSKEITRQPKEAGRDHSPSEEPRGPTRAPAVLKTTPLVYRRRAPSP